MGFWVPPPKVAVGAAAMGLFLGSRVGLSVQEGRGGEGFWNLHDFAHWITSIL